MKSPLHYAHDRVRVMRDAERANVAAGGDEAWASEINARSLDRLMAKMEAAATQAPEAAPLRVPAPIMAAVKPTKRASPNTPFVKWSMLAIAAGFAVIAVIAIVSTLRPAHDSGPMMAKTAPRVDVARLQMAAISEAAAPPARLQTVSYGAWVPVRSRDAVATALVKSGQTVPTPVAAIAAPSDASAAPTPSPAEGENTIADRAPAMAETDLVRRQQLMVRRLRVTLEQTLTLAAKSMNHTSAARSVACRPVAMRTAVVDPAVVPEGRVLYIQETDGLQMRDGSTHDGYWYATAGHALKGPKIDLYTGNETSLPVKGSELKTIEVGEYSGCPQLTVAKR